MISSKGQVGQYGFLYTVPVKCISIASVSKIMLTYELSLLFYVYNIQPALENIHIQTPAQTAAQMMLESMPETLKQIFPYKIE